MKKTLRVLTTLSILASSLLFAHSASAIGTLYPDGSGGGDVACSGGGYFSVLNNVAFDGGGSCRGSVVIPDGVTSLGNNSFYDADITSVTIPNSVTSIGNQAFRDSRLTSITIPASVTTIGDNAFEASRLVSVTIPGTVKNLGMNLFKGANSLTSAVFESGIKTIPGGAFHTAQFLNSVTIPNSVTEIGENAFWNTYSLTSITIPNTVTSIGDYAFGQAFGGGLISVTVPDSVTDIGNHAFRGTQNLTSVTLGSSLTAIRSGTFAYARALTSITIPNSVQWIGSEAFLDTPELLSYTYCGPGTDISSLTNAGLEGKTRLACPAVISAGSEPNSQVVTFPRGTKVADISASSSLPAIKLDFALTAPESVTVIATTNSAPLSATPFMISGSTKIVDIKIPNHDGSAVTVCLEGDSTDRLYHYTSGAWVELDGRSYVNGQVCGVTNSFSPFTAAPAKLVTNPASVAEAAAAAEKAAAEAAAAKREAERRDARVEILRRYAKSEAVTVETYQKAEISGITSTNVDEFNKEILRLPIEKRGDIAEISKVARKYEVVGLIGSDRVKSVYPSLYIEIGLVSADSKIKSTLVKAISGLAENQRSTYNAIKAAIEAKTAELQARTDRLAKVLARSTARNGK